MKTSYQRTRCQVKMLLSRLQIKNLVEKTRQNIRQLGICLKVHDPSKMLNVLVMAQQLRLIDPVEPIVETPQPKTMLEILKIPTAAPRKKRFRNKKLSYGVMSDKEIINTVDEIIQGEHEMEKQAESDKLNEMERLKEIDTLESAIKAEQTLMLEKKNQLKILKDLKLAERKEAAKRKKENINKKKAANTKQLKSQTKTSEVVDPVEVPGKAVELPDETVEVPVTVTAKKHKRRKKQGEI